MQSLNDQLKNCQLNCSTEIDGVQACRREAVPHTQYLRHWYPDAFPLCASCQYDLMIMHEELDDADIDIEIEEIEMEDDP